MKVYKVGGAVRDSLLGREVKDVDWVVVGATPGEMLELGYRQVGRDFPVFLHPDTHEEYALARTERKTAPGYTGFDCSAGPEVTLEDDLARRDLTINAMAEDQDGRIIDPFNGRRDLERRILRHVSPAFVEDPVRILRLARFAARFDFDVADETRALMRRMVEDGEVDALVAERVWSELARALGEAHPARFITVLRDCGALRVLFPEIDALFGVPQTARHHPEIDTGVHVLMALDQAARLSPDPVVRFAVLTHDLGKAATPRETLPAHHGHEQRGVRILHALAERYRIPREYRDLAAITVRFHGHCHRAAELRPATVLKVLRETDAFRRPERFEQFLLACEADARGRKGREHLAYPQADRLRAALRAARAVDTAAVTNQGLDGRAIAQALERLRLDAVTAALAGDGGR